MYAKAEAILHPDNHELIPRVFVLEQKGNTERLRKLSDAVLDIYNEVAGGVWDLDNRRRLAEAKGFDQTLDYVVERLSKNSFLEYRFGIPKLRAAQAREDGKLQARTSELDIADEKTLVVGYWMYTNDSASTYGSPEESVAVRKEFDEAIRVIADAEFSDISIPAPSADRWFMQQISYIDR